MIARWTEADVAALKARRGIKGDAPICAPCTAGQHRKCRRLERPPQPCECERHRAKYKNEPVVVDGIRFDSKREAMRYHELKLEERAGLITDLRRQIHYALNVNGVHITTYVADFVLKRNGEECVIDAKGHRTREYRMKRRLMLAIYGIVIEEV